MGKPNYILINSFTLVALTSLKSISLQQYTQTESDNHAERDTTVQNLQPPIDLKSIDSSFKNQESKQGIIA